MSTRAYLPKNQMEQLSANLVNKAIAYLWRIGLW